jgi:hypothetical protein
MSPSDATAATVDCDSEERWIHKCRARAAQNGGAAAGQQQRKSLREACVMYQKTTQKQNLKRVLKFKMGPTCEAGCALKWGTLDLMQWNICACVRMVLYIAYGICSFSLKR